jgi:hypothetical protein
MDVVAARQEPDPGVVRRHIHDGLMEYQTYRVTAIALKDHRLTAPRRCVAVESIH